MRTRAKPNADEMITRHVDNEDPLDFRVDGADVSAVTEVDALVVTNILRKISGNWDTHDTEPSGKLVTLNWWEPPIT